jgi:AcrR family transcriptional regulator
MVMRKGEMTRAAILDVALELASRDGLEGLTIGLLADRMNMSKSGVFAHFGSREDLQIEVLKLYHRRFEQEVFFPSVKEARGLPRLEAMFNHWVKRVSVEIASGCIYISGAVEYDDRPGPIREAGRDGACLAGRPAALRAAGVDCGDLKRAPTRAAGLRDVRPDPGPAPRCTLPAHPRRRRPRHRGFARLIENYRNPVHSK